MGVSLEHAYKLIHKKEFSFIQIGKRLLLPNLPLKKRSFVRVAKRTGLDNCNFHSLRHTYATRLFELGIPVNVVSKLLGHAKTSITTDIYISLIPQLKTDAVKALDSLHQSKVVH